jgi:hypothetical protein
VGINARLETERAEPLAEVLDPHNYLPWLLSFLDDDSMVCLPFIDPYGDTIFNGLQLPVLLSEFERASGWLSESSLALAKQRYLAGAVSWPELARRHAQEGCERLTLQDLREHCDELIALTQSALKRGPHHYLRFVGD